VFRKDQIAEHHVCDPVARKRSQRVAERRVVRVPAAPRDHRAHSQSIRLGRDELGPQAVRSASCSRLVEHRQRGDDVEIAAHGSQRRQAVLAAAPRDRRARFPCHEMLVSKCLSR
jgi:hypothetical protein